MGYLFVAIGVLARAIIPWLRKLRDEENLSWTDWKWVYVRGQLIGALIVFLAIPALISDFDAVAQMSWQLAWLAGWGVADFGREADKARTNGN